MYRERRIPDSAYPWLEVSWYAWSYNVRHLLDEGEEPWSAVSTALGHLKTAAGLPQTEVKSAAEIINP